MIFAGEVLFLVELVLLVYCVLNVVLTPDSEVRNLPKLVWLVLVVVLPLAGGIAWLVAGRPVGPRSGARPVGGPARTTPRAGRPGAAMAPDDDEAFLSGLRARADAQRREAERQREESQRREDGPEQPGPGQGRPTP